MKKLVFFIVGFILFAGTGYLFASGGYEEITTDALALMPEKYKQKPLCIQVDYITVRNLPPVFNNTNINSDNYFHIMVEKLNKPFIIARKQQFSDEIKDLKRRSFIKVYGRVKRLNRVATPVNNASDIHYFEVEKIEVMDAANKSDPNTTKTEKSKPEKSK